MEMKCKWSNDGICELREGIADDPSCGGTVEEIEECGYVQRGSGEESHVDYFDSYEEACEWADQARKA